MAAYNEVHSFDNRLIIYSVSRILRCAVDCFSYTRMPIGSVWIHVYHLFVCFFFVCTVTDYSAEDKASGVKFCTAVRRRPVLEISNFGELS